MSNKEKLYSEIASKSGVAAADVAKVLAAIGIEKHYAEAAECLGKEPSSEEMFVGYRVSQSCVVV